MRRKVRQFWPMAVDIQETKLQTILEEFIKHVWGNREWKWNFIPSIGALGGILTIWDDTTLEFVATIEGAYTLSTKFKNKSNSVEWVHTNIYRPMEYREKYDFWGELATVIEWWDLPWGLCGDLNAHKSSKDKQGGKINRKDSKMFNIFLDS